MPFGGFVVSLKRQQAQKIGDFPMRLRYILPCKQ